MPLPGLSYIYWLIHFKLRLKIGKYKKNIFTFNNLTKFVREKYPLLQLDCHKWNYTQIYSEKNGPNNRLIKKDKNQTICSTNFKGGTHRKPIGKEGPGESQKLILTKHKQLIIAEVT